LSLNRIFPGAKFTLHPSLGFSYIGSVTARHSSNVRQPNFAAFSKGHHLYSTGRQPRWASARILAVFSFFITLFLFGSVWRIKLAVRQLLGARKCSVSYCISYHVDQELCVKWASTERVTCLQRWSVADCSCVSLAVSPHDL